jgi:hypothetical protein
LLNAEPDVLNTMARVWEPAAADGNIVHVLRDNGIPGPSLKPIGDSFDPFHRRSPARARIWPRPQPLDPCNIDRPDLAGQHLYEMSDHGCPVI